MWIQARYRNGNDSPCGLTPPLHHTPLFVAARPSITGRGASRGGSGSISPAETLGARIEKLLDDSQPYHNRKVHASMSRERERERERDRDAHQVSAITGGHGSFPRCSGSKTGLLLGGIGNGPQVQMATGCSVMVGSQGGGSELDRSWSSLSPPTPVTRCVCTLGMVRIEREGGRGETTVSGGEGAYGQGYLNESSVQVCVGAGR